MRRCCAVCAADHPQPRTPTHNAKLHLQAAADLLDWLLRRGTTLAGACQGDIDTWLDTGPGACHARDFLIWTSQHGHSRRLCIPPAGQCTDDTLDLTDRVAGSLVLCYAQQLSRITALTTDQVTRDTTATTIRFGAHHVTLAQPLAGLLGALIDTPRSHIGIGAPATSRWLFPGHHPGQPLTPSQLSVRLRRLGVATMTARRATLIHLAAQLPAAVLADLLNLSVWRRGRLGQQRRRRLVPLRRRARPRRHSRPTGIATPTTSCRELLRLTAIAALTRFAHATGWHEVKIISERLGHASVGITPDTYSHVLPGADQETAHTLARGVLGQ